MPKKTEGSGGVGICLATFVEPLWGQTPLGGKGSPRIDFRDLFRPEHTPMEKLTERKAFPEYYLWYNTL